ncbi:DNA methyltransferase [Leifsonia sp. fls2-241-R2A-40a]|uniref:DNA methyltransferase n=1 Tax=Leifsonia sp. fls2-241-R2A-40a TaxID=3040290 RepID=UPI00254B0FF7|nr:DNA methyltransferase [Leifsonia sp. fls2-241-R2A-40a]
MAKSLSLNEIRSRAAKLSRDWADEPGDERQQAQSFVRDLLAVYGITETRAAYYERRVKRASTGSRGYIDALIPGLALIEMKSAGKDLAAAEQQALDYIHDLPDPEIPRWVLTSDFRRFRLIDLHDARETAAVEFSLADLRDHAEKLAFFAGYGERSFGSKEQEAASIKAAKLMAGLYDGLEGSGYSDHEASVFLVRTLFALYADDAGLWEKDLFLEFLETRTAEDGSDLGPELSLLYQVLGREPSRRQSNLDELIARFPYVNGGVFEEPLSIPSFDQAMRTRLIEAALFNWSAISPAIFGSLFQAVKDKVARRELGEHYTTETNILKVIGPMFLDELRQRFVDGYHDARALSKLRADMGLMRFLDPACGCGNFLVVAYREMRALDLEVLLRLQQLSGETARTMFFTEEHLSVRLSSFHGIELEEWPAQIAATALHLVEHQANRAMESALGAAPDTLPLDKIQTIHVGNALRMDWTTVTDITDHLYVMGNPPFIGMSRMTADQQADNRLTFAAVDSSGLRAGRLDYVACWYAKAMASLRGVTGARVAFVSTNSITQGEQARTMVPLLERNGFTVDFGHRTFRWTSEAPGAASVHCVVVGFSASARPGRKPRLFTYNHIGGQPIERPVQRLNFYLADGASIVPAKLNRPATIGMPNAHKGSQPTDGGHLIVTEEQLPQVLADEKARRYLRQFVQGQDMLQGRPLRSCLWMKYAEPADIRASPILRERLAGVRSAREESPTSSVRDYANKPGLFTQDRQPDKAYFALPEVSSENRTWIPGRFYTPDVIAGNKLIIFPGAFKWQAGLLQSSMFMAWVTTFAGRLKSDISISPGLAYFPVPWPTPDEATMTKLSHATDAVFDARAVYRDASLADLYDPNAMPANLLEAHQHLDEVVDRAFGARRRFTDTAERLSFLIDAYTRREAGEQLVPVSRRRG